MFLSFADMAALQHGAFIGAGFLPVERAKYQSLVKLLPFAEHPVLRAADRLDALDAQAADLLRGKLAGTAHAHNIGFLAVDAVFFDQLVKAVRIARFQKYQGLSGKPGSLDHIFT